MLHTPFDEETQVRGTSLPCLGTDTSPVQIGALRASVHGAVLSRRWRQNSSVPGCLGLGAHMGFTSDPQKYWGREGDFSGIEKRH